MTAALWPNVLPYPQLDTLGVQPPNYTDPIDVLSGPTRQRLARRHARPTYTFEIWFNADQAEFFEAWYWGVTITNGGELYLPWIGGGMVVAFPDEYQMTPLGKGWHLSALVVGLYLDPTICDAHIGLLQGLLKDTGPPVADVVIDDGAAVDIIKDDFPLDALEVC